MTLSFKKYQGTGNDFVMLDAMKGQDYSALTREKIERLCDRRFGIGADGLIILTKSDHVDFRMVYYNSDGNQSTMCGNGARCIVRFAYDLGLITNEELKTIFEAIDGLHVAYVLENNVISLKMNDVGSFKNLGNEAYELNTGSPHYVKIIDEIPTDVKKEGSAIRYNDDYTKEGINVNFVVVSNQNVLQMATYERGVEDETYSCGTGVVAAAVSYSLFNILTEPTMLAVVTKGGNLAVKLNPNPSGATDIWLIAEAKMVFEGEIEV